MKSVNLAYETTVRIHSATGKIHWTLKPNRTAIELAKEFTRIAQYLRSANHRTTGLENISMSIEVDDDLGPL